jgi:acyl-CoA thioesterase I
MRLRLSKPGRRPVTASIRIVLTLATLLFFTVPGVAVAEAIKIAVFGDSSTYGSGPGGRGGRTGLTGGVPTTENFAAKLERALRARGWDISVSDKSAPGRLASGAAPLVSSQIPAGTQLSIVVLGATDINYRRASPAEVAFNLNALIDALHSRGSMVIVVKQWGAAVTAAINSADAIAGWWNGMYGGAAVVRPEYDSGDGEHLNSAGFDIVVARAVPDVERVLASRGFRSGS